MPLMHIYIFSELKLSAISNPEYEAPELQPLCSKVTRGLKSVVIQAHTTLFYGRQLSQSHEWQVNSDQTFLEISLSPWPLIKFLHIHDTKSQHKKTPSYSSWPCAMHSYDLDLRDSKADFLRYSRADLS